MKIPASGRWLGESLAVFAAYYAAALLGLAVSIGPGHITAIWPPSGIALTAFLLRGRSFLPAILLANVAFNLNAHFNSPEAPLLMYAAAMGISLGSTAQAWIAARQIRRRTSAPTIISVGDSLRFIAIVIVCCTIAPSIGAYSLLQADLIDLTEVDYIWFTWWIGDLCGMLVVPPLVLLLRSWRKQSWDWASLAFPIIAIGCAFTLIGAFLANHLNREAQEREFLRTAAAMTAALDRSVELALRDVTAAQALFYKVDLDRREFSTFAAALLRQNRQLDSIAWQPQVAAMEKSRFESWASKEVDPRFYLHDLVTRGNLVPPSQRTDAFPILFLESEYETDNLIGLDAASDPVRYEAIIAAELSGNPVATPPVELITHEPDNRGFVVYVPIYKGAYLRDPKEKNAKRVRGVVAAAFHTTRLMGTALTPFASQPVEVWIADSTNPDRQQVIYHQRRRPDGGVEVLLGAPLPNLRALRRGIHYEAGMIVAGRDWRVFISPLDPKSTLQTTELVITILLAGTAFTTMLASYMMARQRSESELRARDERLMRQNAVLAQLTRREMVTPVTLGDSFKELTASAAYTLATERVSIWMLNEDNSRLRCACLFRSRENVYEEGIELRASDYPAYFAALLENRRIAADEARSDSRTREFTQRYLLPLDIHAMLDAPVRLGGRLIGVVCHEHTGSPRQWTLDEQNFAGSMGDLASLFLESAHRSEAESALSEANRELERKIAERTRELQSANERLRQLDQLKSMFIASMSHELRTPLNSIIGFTGVVLQGISGPLNDRQKDQLGRVYGSARHLLSLISDVIDISKIEAGYVEIYRESFPLEAVIEEAVTAVQHLRVEKALGLDTKVEPGLVLYSDRKRLYQCILNLVSNAVKYSERGTISIHAERVGLKVRIAIQDQGIGVKEEAFSRLFQPFERIDTHLRIKTPGTGLGLYLTKKIMTELLQGDVGVTSEAGVGSTFFLTIPINANPAQGTDTP